MRYRTSREPPLITTMLLYIVVDIEKFTLLKLAVVVRCDAPAVVGDAPAVVEVVVRGDALQSAVVDQELR